MVSQERFPVEFARALERLPASTGSVPASVRKRSSNMLHRLGLRSQTSTTLAHSGGIRRIEIGPIRDYC